MTKKIAKILLIIWVGTASAEVELLSIIGELDGKTSVLSHDIKNKESNYFYYLMSEYKKDNSADIVYKKISSTKYRIFLSSKHSVIPFVFSDTFDKNWKAYIVNQKSKEEFNYFNENEVILHEPVSRQDKTITDGSMWETWLVGIINSQCDKKSTCIESHNTEFSLDSGINSHAIEISHITHKTANSYANSWALDTYLINNISDINDLNLYRKDEHGNHQYEIIIEFWPQRLFILGVLFSILVFSLCVIYIGIQAYRKSSLENSNLAEYV